jgi:hypothetical protein
MNLTISNAKVNTWKSIRTRYVAAACCIALVATALVGFDLRTPTVAAPLTSAFASTAPHFLSQNSTGLQVAFYLVADKAAAEQAQAYEEMAQWIRHDSRVLEPNRSVVTLAAGSDAEYILAQSLIDDAMAAANFSDTNPAPSFSVVDLR